MAHRNLFYSRALADQASRLQDADDDDDDEENEEEDGQDENDDDADDADDAEEEEEEEDELADSDYVIKLKVKKDDEDEFTRLDTTYGASWSSVQKMFHAEFRAPVRKVYYLDAEGDKIVIRSQKDMKGAWNFFFESEDDMSHLKLFVETTDKPAGTSASFAPSSGPGASAAYAPSATVSPTGRGPSQSEEQIARAEATARALPAVSSSGSIHSGVPLPPSDSSTMRGQSGTMSSTSRRKKADIKPADFKSWRKGRLLGKGTFGSVYQGLLASRGETAAVKVIELGGNAEEARTELSNIANEMRLLQKLDHDNIVRYYGCDWLEKERTMHIFMEFCTDGSLNSMIKNFGKLAFPTVAHYTEQILMGLQYLHESGIIHRDIKGDNILVDKGVVKLADFGCSKQLGDLASKTQAGTSTMVGTPYWMAPEVITGDGSGYGPKADIWSVGCTVVEMLTGKHPWPEFPSMWAAIYHIANSTGLPPQIPEKLPRYVRTFLELCFERQADLRPSAAELRTHPFITKSAELPSCDVEEFTDEMFEAERARCPSASGSRSFSAAGMPPIPFGRPSSAKGQLS